MIILVLAFGVSAPLPDPTTPAPPPAFASAAPLDAAVLSRSTAREDTTLVASSDQAAQVSGNTITGQTVTGTVTIDGNAFQNAQGFTLINANSGNNVAMNSSLNVNVQFSPAP